jgi:hypothetical protein
MKKDFIPLLLFPALAFSATVDVDGKPDLARYGVHCVAKSQTPQGSLDADFNGAISVCDQNQDGTLKLGSIGAFTFVTDFNFRISHVDNGVVSFAFQNTRGVTLARSSMRLPKYGEVKSAVYYYDTATNVAANVVCTVTSQMTPAKRN